MGNFTVHLGIAFSFIALIFTGCRSEKEQAPKYIDLSKRLSYSEKSQNNQIIVFGTPEAKQFLISGWSEPGKDGNETFQAAAADKVSFSFKSSKDEPVFLHMRLGSFFANSAQVLLNNKTVGTIQVDDKPKLYSLQLPAEALKPDNNVVELDWNEVRKLTKRRNSPELAAMAYFAVVGPIKYVFNDSIANHALAATTVQVGEKARNAITQPLGGGVRFFEKLNKDSRLEFEMFYDPADSSKKDQFADFSITTKRWTT